MRVISTSTGIKKGKIGPSYPFCEHGYLSFFIVFFETVLEARKGFLVDVVFAKR